VEGRGQLPIACSFLDPALGVRSSSNMTSNSSERALTSHLIETGILRPPSLDSSDLTELCYGPTAHLNLILRN